MKLTALKSHLLTSLFMTSYHPHILLDSSIIQQYLFLSLSVLFYHYGFVAIIIQSTWTLNFFTSSYLSIIISLICKNGEYSSIFTSIVIVSHMHPVIMHSIHLYVENLDLFAMNCYVLDKIRILLLVCNLLNYLNVH